MANETFEKLLSILEGRVANSQFRMSDARRAVLIEALKIAIKSGIALEPRLRPALPDDTPFDLRTLTFSERHRLWQLRDGPLMVPADDVQAPLPNWVLKNHGLIDVQLLEGQDAGIALLTITSRGLAASSL